MFGGFLLPDPITNGPSFRGLPHRAAGKPARFKLRTKHPLHPPAGGRFPRTKRLKAKHPRGPFSAPVGPWSRSGLLNRGQSPQLRSFPPGLGHRKPARFQRHANSTISVGEPTVALFLPFHRPPQRATENDRPLFHQSDGPNAVPGNPHVEKRITEKTLGLRPLRFYQFANRPGQITRPGKLCGLGNPPGTTWHGARAGMQGKKRGTRPKHPLPGVVAATLHKKPIF